jgi:hypothetical protein
VSCSCKPVHSLVLLQPLVLLQLHSCSKKATKIEQSKHATAPLLHASSCWPKHV